MKIYFIKFNNIIYETFGIIDTNKYHPAELSLNMHLKETDHYTFHLESIKEKRAKAAYTIIDNDTYILNDIKVRSINHIDNTSVIVYQLLIKNNNINVFTENDLNIIKSLNCINKFKL